MTPQPRAPRLPRVPAPRSPFPRVLTPRQVQQQAHQHAVADVNAAVGALPSQETISQPYTDAQTRIGGYAAGLADQLRQLGAYTNQMGQGVAGAFQSQADAAQRAADAEVIAAGGQPVGSTQAAQGAHTLGSFGTSAANQIGEIQAAAPLAGAQYQDRLSTALAQALGQRSDQVAGLEAKLPSLTQQYRSQLDTLNNQVAAETANYGLAQQQAASLAGYRQDQTALGAARVRESATAAAANRANQWRIAQARINAATQTAATRAQQTGDRQAATQAAAARSAFARAQDRVSRELQTRFKGTTSSRTVTTPSGTEHETFSIPGAPGQPPTLKTIDVPINQEPNPSSVAPGATLVSKTPDPGRTSTVRSTMPGNRDRAVDWAVAFLAGQNHTYGWGLSHSDIVRMAQQTARTYWGPEHPQQRANPARASHNHPY